MFRPSLILPVIVAAALAVPVVGQTPDPAPASASAAQEPSKACLTARKKEDKEQRSLSAAIDAIAKDTKGRESCSTKSMCERYDAAISAMEKRKARHQTRLAQFKEDAANDCKAP
jgi:hypothetical protein